MPEILCNTQFVAHYDGAHRFTRHRFNKGFGMVIKLNIKHVNDEFRDFKRVPLFINKKFIFGNKIHAFLDYRGPFVGPRNEFRKEFEIDAWVIILKTHKDEHNISFDLEESLPPLPTLDVDRSGWSP